MAIVFRNGRVVDPSQGVDAVADLWVEDGRVVAVGSQIEAPVGAEIVDAQGLIVTPGLVDVHAHLRDPGYLAKETLETGAASALRGGFTAVCCMPNTNPALDRGEHIADIVERARDLPVRIYPLGSITVGRRLETLADLDGMARTGAVGFSD
ncbi:MAG TPA: amidohydrolase family protein, partial [Nitrolancea sp.]|nr:amidohydrolase family protein [Nitrolancea sp.]